MDDPVAVNKKNHKIFNVCKTIFTLNFSEEVADARTKTTTSSHESLASDSMGGIDIVVIMTDQ
ncbi:hypothetical protein DD238_002564 [Peronospora effusa]|uniref:Uncharacterized protein n=1 Tax=Peronospora effusa TaxID=542832 RepID=A0A3M6VKG2_9STRA|nr:hypothetical protein DD238_002564 [Peronospora effusa]RQM14409.1 hypothetical protein DD237_004687 [Peronospora effusa]